MFILFLINMILGIKNLLKKIYLFINYFYLNILHFFDFIFLKKNILEKNKKFFHLNRMKNFSIPKFEKLRF